MDPMWLMSKILYEILVLSAVDLVSRLSINSIRPN